jgi:hypothetical protein
MLIAFILDGDEWSASHSVYFIPAEKPLVPTQLRSRDPELVMIWNIKNQELSYPSQRESVY